MGSLLSFDENGCPLIDYEGNEGGAPRAALSCLDLAAENAGCEVAIGFLNNDKSRPLILGVIRRRHQVSRAKSPTPPVMPAGVEMTISADQELVLKCGKASITLTRDGKILLSGEYVVSRSYGVNRIQGASVQIN